MIKPAANTAALALRLIALLPAFLLLAASPEAFGQDPMTVAPIIYKTLLDNERVRVLEQELPPEVKEPTHSHPAYVKYLLTPFKGTTTTREGTSTVRTVKAGKALWHEAWTHAEKNLGSSPIKAIIVELKGKQIVQPHQAQLANDPLKVAASSHKLLFQNDRIRVLDFLVHPGDSVAFHNHYDRVTYVLSGGTITETLAGGKSVSHDLKAGATTWNEAVLHAITNTGTTDVHVVTFELRE